MKKNDVTMVRPRYDPETGEFKGLYKTIGYLVVRGSPEEVFFDYGYDKEKSKVIYSYYRRRIPNSFSRIIFNRHRIQIESGEIDGDSSRIFFFFPATADRSKEINRYLDNVSISLIHVSQEQLNTWAGTSFDPSKFDLFGLEKNTMSDAVVKCLKHVNDICNSNIVRNADGVFSWKEDDVPVDWIGDNKQRVPPQKFKVSC